MEKLIDLHTHSLKSDGSMTPAEVVREAKRAGLAAIALSDHDTVDGIREAVAEGEKIGVEVIPAIEFSVQSKTETHILGYFIDIENPDLLKTLKEVVDLRIERNYVTCQRLNELGFDITIEEVRALAPNNFVGRAHFARVLMDKGYTKSVKEGFDLYMTSGKYAYCEKQRLTARNAVELIGKCGGISFLAHPHLTKLGDDELKEFLKELKGFGLSGLEGYYTDYTPEMQEKYQAMARELGLLISGGTDFHAAMKPHISIGTGLGNMKIPYSVLEAMKAERDRLKKE
ncbi:MAG: PHP domain-containing protein [Oscillospiraceae bacterium]|nr:PHP domain-containing protein [Oscillospiraceae bacterium]